MSFKVKLKGLASGNSTDFIWKSQLFHLTLLEFLSTHDVSLASSCSGEGVCQKCMVSLNGGIGVCDILSCQFNGNQLKLREEVRDGELEVLVNYL